MNIDDMKAEWEFAQSIVGMFTDGLVACIDALFELTASHKVQ